MNIPIYRARRIDSDEYKIGQLTNLVIPDIERISNDEQKDIEREAYFITKGSLCKNVGNSFEYCGENRFVYMISELNEIDPTTLAIHFEDMLDSQGNKIFASFSEDGKGGDKFLFDNEIFIIWFDNQSLKINATNKDNFESNCHDSLNEWYDFTNKCYDLKVLGIQE